MNGKPTHEILTTPEVQQYILNDMRYHIRNVIGQYAADVQSYILDNLRHHVSHTIGRYAADVLSLEMYYNHLGEMVTRLTTSILTEERKETARTYQFPNIYSDGKYPQAEIFIIKDKLVQY